MSHQRDSLEGCLEKIPNHFQLCAVAAKRARQLARGAPSDVAAGTHKSTVQSLMEISRGLVDASVLDQADLPVADPPPMHLELLGEY